MKREITSHRDGGLNDRLKIVTGIEAPSAGGADWYYEITAGTGSEGFAHGLTFQHEIVGVAGIHGLTNEALVAVVIDRLERFQLGPFSCSENERALELLTLALFTLRGRVADRIARGVLDRHAP